jgi:hypothetical protein
VIDAKFIEVITDTITPTASSGQSAEDALADIRTALDAVNTRRGGLFWLVGPDTAKRAATLTPAAGLPVFPSMSPTGGEIVNVPALVCDALTDDLILVNARGIAGEIDGYETRISRQADLEMSDAPGQDSTTSMGASMTSLWQSGAVGVQVLTRFGVERLRDNAVAIISGVAWGDPAS